MNFNRRGFCLPSVRLFLGAFITALVSLSPSLSMANAENAAPPPSSSASLGALFGDQLTATELTSLKGTVDWLLTETEMDAIAQFFSARDIREGATRAAESTVDARSAESDLGIAALLAMFEPEDFEAASRSDHPIQLALLDSFPAINTLTDQLMRFQGAAAFDTSVRFLCSDKIYGDLYPGGTGWNNHTYSACGSEKPGDPARTSDIRPLVFTRPDNPGGGDTGTIIPCGGSLVNSTSMTIQSQGTSELLNFAKPAAVIIAGTPMPFHGGHHW